MADLPEAKSCIHLCEEPINTPWTHTVCFPESDLHIVESNLRRLTGFKTFVRLNTQGPWHSKHLAVLADELAALLARFDFSDPKFTIVDNTDAGALKSDDIVKNLTRHLYSPVRWGDSLQFLFHEGVREFFGPEGSEDFQQMLLFTLPDASFSLIEESCAAS